MLECVDFMLQIKLPKNSTPLKSKRLQERRQKQLVAAKAAKQEKLTAAKKPAAPAKAKPAKDSVAAKKAAAPKPAKK